MSLDVIRRIAPDHPAFPGHFPGQLLAVVVGNHCQRPGSYIGNDLFQLTSLK